MTDMDCASEIMPALANETIITVVADDDWTRAVTSMPTLDPYAIENMRPANYVPEIFNQQIRRNRGIQVWTRRTLQSNERGTNSIYSDPKETWTNLIDGDANTKWSPLLREKYWGSINNSDNLAYLYSFFY